MPRPGRRVPQVMSITMILGLVTTLPLMIALNLFITDFQAVINAPVPSIEIVYQAYARIAQYPYYDANTSR